MRRYALYLPSKKTLAAETFKTKKAAVESRSIKEGEDEVVVAIEIATTQPRAAVPVVTTAQLDGYDAILAKIKSHGEVVANKSGD